MISGISNVQSMFQARIDDIYISYLPLAHIFDRLGIYYVMYNGGSTGFFGGEVLKIIDDLALLRPTLFVSVPRLLNKVYQRI